MKSSKAALDHFVIEHGDSEGQEAQYISSQGDIAGDGSNMMSKEFLKKLSILGVTMGLTASPLVLAQQTQQDEFENQPSTEEPGNYPGTDAAPARETGAGVDAGDPAAPGIDATTEPGEDPAMPGTEAAPRTDPAAPDAQDEAGFGEGTEPMPGDDIQYEYENEEEEWDYPEDEEDQSAS
jgi:hypothetical protein